MLIVSRVVAVEEIEEDETFLVAFAENSDGTGHSLTIRCPRKGPGEDSGDYAGYCVIVDGGPCAYDCIERAELEGDLLRLVLNDAGSQTLGLPRQLEVQVPSSVSHDDLADGLTRVFAGRPVESIGF